MKWAIFHVTFSCFFFCAAQPWPSQESGGRETGALSGTERLRTERRRRNYLCIALPFLRKRSARAPGILRIRNCDLHNRVIRTVDRSENETAAAVVERERLVPLQRVSLCVDMLSLVELW